MEFQEGPKEIKSEGTKAGGIEVKDQALGMILSIGAYGDVVPSTSLKASAPSTDVSSTSSDNAVNYAPSTSDPGNATANEAYDTNVGTDPETEARNE